MKAIKVKGFLAICSLLFNLIDSSLIGFSVHPLTVGIYGVANVMTYLYILANFVLTYFLTRERENKS